MSKFARPPLSVSRAVRITVIALSLAAVGSAQTDPALRVYEGFNGYNAGTIQGQNPNDNTIGLNQSVAYYDGNGSRGLNFTLQTSSLSLGPLQTSGGSLAFTNSTNVVGAKIDIGATAFTGTLWSSYLVNLSLRGAASGDGAVIRVGSAPSDSTNAYFNSWSDSRANADTKNVSISYGTAGTEPPNNGTGPLVFNTTYIIINRFTKVGTAATTGNPGVATLWALNEDQFKAFIDAGGDETALNNTSVTATATQSVTSGTRTFATGLAIGLVTVKDVGVYDEIRFGSTLESVTPVPEPATAAALAGLVSAALCGFARRRRT